MQAFSCAAGRASGLALRLAAKHARELAGSSSDAWGGWRGLVKEFNADRPALVETVVASLSGITGEIGGNDWLAVAAQLAPVASSDALAQGLERFLARTGETLPIEVGDGPFDMRLAGDADAASAIAGLIWARLGHPQAAMRWRAAHAVRRLAEIERFVVIDRIVERFDAPGGLPFCDTKLPFYLLHARLWLLMALARVALDRPDAILRYRAMLERVAFSTEFPHVVMRSCAIDALRQLAALIDSSERDAIKAKLATANCSPFPHVPRPNYGENRYLPRPDAAPRPADAFDFSTTTSINTTSSAFPAYSTAPAGRSRTALLAGCDVGTRPSEIRTTLLAATAMTKSWSSGYNSEG